MLIAYFIFIDSQASHRYIVPNLVEIFQLKKCKNDRSWMVQLDIGTKIKINELVKSCPLGMNGLDSFAYLNIILLGLYDVLIGMDWLDAH